MPISIHHLCKSLNVLLLSDSYYHVNAEANGYIKEVLGLLECFGQKSHAQIETHTKGSTSDHVIKREN